MAELCELWREELETLQSIYQDDDNLRIVDSSTLTYKFTPEGNKDFIVQFELTSSYPDEVPNIHMEILYNTKITAGIKSAIVRALASEGQQLIGVQMLYSLLEWGRDNLGAVITEYKTESVDSQPSCVPAPAIKQERKEQLSKAAKRKLADKTDTKGEHARGWNWVDVIKHLSKTATT